MFVACGIWCLADVSSVSPSSEQTRALFETCSALEGRSSGGWGACMVGAA